MAISRIAFSDFRRLNLIAISQKSNNISQIYLKKMVQICEIKQVQCKNWSTEKIMK